jgi:acetylornithine deacetylase/succinyl-diaminopimelate desuccinylase-like protein
LNVLVEQVRAYCQSTNLDLNVTVNENGIACDPHNPYLLKLQEAVHTAFGEEPVLGKKLPGTSARFAPRGQGVVWGQSGIGPHARDERHYIPSISGYYRALMEYGKALSNHR